MIGREVNTLRTAARERFLNETTANALPTTLGRDDEHGHECLNDPVAEHLNDADNSVFLHSDEGDYTRRCERTPRRLRIPGVHRPPLHLEQLDDPVEVRSLREYVLNCHCVLPSKSTARVRQC